MQHCGDSGGAGAIMRTGINRMQPRVSHGGATLYSYLVFGQSGQRFLMPLASMAKTPPNDGFSCYRIL